MDSPTGALSLEAKLVVLGAQGVGKTSLVHRYVKHSFIPPNKVQSTVGASFLATKVHDAESNTTMRLQIWDTAGQERFRSISRLYYRGANAAILCYDVTSQRSFEEMAEWLKELRENCGTEAENDLIIHIVGTKADVAASDPKKRAVPFERCIEYVGQKLLPGIGTQAHPPASLTTSKHPPNHVLTTPASERSSAFWGHEALWDCCHEVSAKDGEGIDEVFRVITRKLVDQHSKRQEKLRQQLAMQAKTPGIDGAIGGAAGYFDLPNGGHGSFRVGHGDKRRSWLGALTTPGGLSSYTDDNEVPEEVAKAMMRGRCC